MSNSIRKIAINTGGGDAPGLNAVIRAATLAAVERDIEIWGISHGYRGLLEDPREGLVRLDADRVRGITHVGGTILGTANRGNPFAYPTLIAGQADPVPTDRSSDIVRRFREEGFEALIAVGGDGSLRLAHRLYELGLPAVIGVPKTIDNDVRGTDVTFGFDTAVCIAVEAIGRLHTTAEAHDRIFVVEVMGRDAGFIALWAGVAGGADVILIPEVPFRYEALVEKILLRERRGRHFSIVVVAEGAREQGGHTIVKSEGDVFRGTVVLGGIAERVAKELAKRTGKESRSMVLGHLQRGGEPTTHDRLLGLRFGAAAVRFIVGGAVCGMVGVKGHDIVLSSLQDAASGTRTVALDDDTVITAREMGLCFGDESPGHFRARPTPSIE